MAIDRLKHAENLSIPDVVKELRDQRMHAVQNDQVPSCDQPNKDMSSLIYPPCVKYIRD